MNDVNGCRPSHSRYADCKGQTSMTTLVEKYQSLANLADKIKWKLETEEATKNSLFMPFISALGYDVFDIAQVVP